MGQEEAKKVLVFTTDIKVNMEKNEEDIQDDIQEDGVNKDDANENQR